ncbi:hypothetical protein ACFQU7_04860 [Pseudoroseomonas wenyumeiae]
MFEAPPVQRGNRADPELISQLTPGCRPRPMCGRFWAPQRHRHLR